MTLTCLAEQHVVVCGLCLLPEPIVESCRAAHVFEEDLRTAIDGYEVVEVRQSARQTGAPAPMRIEVADAEIDLLKERVMYDLNSVEKAKDRPRRRRSND